MFIHIGLKYRDTYLRARMEAEKVSDAVFKGSITKDKNAIGAVGNNEMVLYKYAKSGLIYDMAKKYNVPMRKEKIEAFIDSYKKE